MSVNTPLFICGAETGDTDLECNLVAGTTSTVTSPVNNIGASARAYRVNPTTTGTGSFDFQSFSASNGKFVAVGGSTTLYASFYFRPSTLPAATNEIIAGFYTGGTAATAVATLRITSGGLLAIYDSASALVATGATVLTTNGGSHNGFYRIDVSANRTTGAYNVRIEFIPELGGTGASFGATNIGNFAVGKVANTNGNTVDFYYDDIWLDSVAFPDFHYAIAIDIPTSNGSTMSWTGGTGASDYTQVNEVPGDATSTIADPTSGSIPVVAQFNMQTFAQMGIPSIANIWAIQTHTQVKDGAGTVVNTFAQGVTSNGVDSLNTTNANTSTAYVPFGRILLTDPATSLAWTKDGVEQVKFKLNEGTSAVNTTVSNALISVAYSPRTALYTRSMRPHAFSPGLAR